MKFSLMFFSSDSTLSQHKYKLIVESSKFADQANFEAVWLPERHFHRFGGLFPNPSVIGAALAVLTTNLRIRAGSIILPLHDPIRVAEEWSVVDNLSGGRVDLAFAQGWNPNDYTLAPSNYVNRLDLMFEGIKLVQTLWQGNEVVRTNGIGDKSSVKIYPPALQQSLPYWITCSKDEERFRQAGEIGANVLTALLLQNRAELKQKISLYRESLTKSDKLERPGYVTLMLHSFVGPHMNTVRETVRPALTKYIEDSVDLWRQRSIELDGLSERDRSRVLRLAFERYYRESSLCGTPDTLLPFVKDLTSVGVDEIACLIDFGLPDEEVLRSLEYLRDLKDRCIP